jgi:hypothetical protein
MSRISAAIVSVREPNNSRLIFSSLMAHLLPEGSINATGFLVDTIHSPL